MKHLVLASFALFAVPLFAQGPILSQQIVVTASALPDTVEDTPAAVSVVTREQIGERAALDVADALREVPGLAVARTGSPGKSTTLFMRGGSSKQALILWNGVEMNNPFFSGYNFGQLSTVGIERVEVVRGPFSALYGSEAVSGVVNVLTTPKRSGASLALEGGERGLWNGAAFGSMNSDRWNAHAAIERRTDDGFAANDDFRSDTFLGSAMWTPGPRLSIGVMARHNGYELGIPQIPNAEFTAFVPSPRRREEGSESQIVAPLRYETSWAGWEVRLSDSRRSEDFSDPDGPFGPEASETDSRIRGARATARVGTITIGGEYEESAVDHVSGFSTIDSRSRTNRSLFAEDRLSFGRLELTAGLRYDDFETFGREFSPRLAAAWSWPGHKVRAAYGQGFRAPAIGELYSPFFGNPELDAERSRSIEAGYDRFGRNSSVSVTLFRSEYEELIVFGSNFTFENIAAARAHGVELSGALRAGRFDAAASYTWLDTSDEQTGQTLVRRPEHSGSLALSYRGEAFSVRAVLTHAGRRADVTDLAPFGRVMNDAYTIADVIVAYRLSTFEPFLKIENLSDERYEEVFGYPSARRRVRVGVRYNR